PGWASMQSTSTRAYAWIRGSTREILVGRGEPEPGTDHDVRRARTRRVTRDGVEEGVPLERQEPAVGLCFDRRRSRHVAEQGDLAERVARAELTARRAVHGHAQSAGFHDVEAVAMIALSDDRGARGRYHGVELRRQPLEGRRRQRRE